MFLRTFRLVVKRSSTPIPCPSPQGGGEAAPGNLGRRVLVGRFGAPHGVRGEIRLQSFTQDPKAIGGYGPLLAADGRRFELTGVRVLKEAMLVVRVADIADRTGAEQLTHLDLFVDRAALPVPEENEFYVADLIGLDAIDADGSLLGVVVDVPNYGGGDLIEVRPSDGGETTLYPFTREVAPMIDLAGRRVTIIPPAEMKDDPKS